MATLRARAKLESKSHATAGKEVGGFPPVCPALTARLAELSNLHTTTAEFSVRLGAAEAALREVRGDAGECGRGTEDNGGDAEGGNSEVSVDKYAVLTSFPVSLDKARVAITPVDSNLLGDGPLLWSDYIAIHGTFLGILHGVRPFVFHSSMYTSLEDVRWYTKMVYKTLLWCAKYPTRCHSLERALERAAEELLQNSVTDEVKRKVDGN